MTNMREKIKKIKDLINSLNILLYSQNKVIILFEV